jgi:glutamate synthase domain-containing protein 2
MRYVPYLLSFVFTALFLWMAIYFTPWHYLGVAVFGFFALLGTYDLIQTEHTILRNYPLQAHLRFIAEELRPELMQYFVERDTEGRPYDRNHRSVVYQRSKGAIDEKPFGTQLDVYTEEYEWLEHSITPKPKSTEQFRVDVGGEECSKPYSASVLNISAMSFGALGKNAIMSLNKGAKLGGFYHDTGEGGCSKYHQKEGGDLVWEVGSGYFGCRNDDGTFNEDKFRDTSQIDNIKMVEIKVSQGAKAGHGGILPGPKVSKEIAEARGVPAGVDCISPAYHTAFSTPKGLLEFTAELRDLSGGKPAGFKLCIGRHAEFMGICKAMVETNIYPDFIVIDGGEGGTGAGPIEFVDHMGSPLIDGLIFAQNALVGSGVRDKIKLAAAAKITSAFEMARVMALGADWCNAARAFMFSIGCIQALRCQTNSCPAGVATQDSRRQRGLVVTDKSQRVFNFHRNTMDDLAQVIAACGLEHPRELSPKLLCHRTSALHHKSYYELFEWCTPNMYYEDKKDCGYTKMWNMASSESFC